MSKTVNMNGKVEVTFFENNSDLDKIVFFLNNALPFNYSESTFLWEYGHERSIFGYIKDEHDTVIGTQGMIPIKLYAGANQIITAKSETSYLAPFAKGKGLFKKLYLNVLKETTNQEISMVWGFTALGELWKKLGFEVKENCLFTYSLSISPKKNYYLSKNTKDNRTISVLRYFKAIRDSKFLNFRLNKSTSKNKFLAKELQFRSELINENDIEIYFKKLRSQNTKLIHIDLSKAYLNYRIKTNPFLKYTAVYLYNSRQEMLGFYIFSVKEKIANMVEFNGVSTEIKEVLLAHIVKEVKKLHVVRLNFFGNKTNYLVKDSFDLLGQYGATSFDSEMSIVVRNNEGTNVDFENWYINGLWTEGINL